MADHKRKVAVCPECKGNQFQHDSIHDETYCTGCGLVLLSPPVCGVVFPGFLITIN